MNDSPPFPDVPRYAPADLEVEARLGVGATAEAIVAVHRPSGRRVLVKRFHAPRLASGRFRAAVRDEIRLLRRLDHPSVVRFLGVLPDLRGLVLELVEGPTLAQRLASGPLPAAEAMSMGADIADALAATHALEGRDGRSLDVVHRDVTPSNILLRSGGPACLADFGVARLREDQRSGVTAPNTRKGTAPYMSPEQIRGGPVTSASDVFSLGAVLHEALTGRQLFGGASPAEIAGAVLFQTVVPPSRLRAEIPSDVDRAVERMLHREPSARPHAREVAGWLRVEPTRPTGDRI